MLPSSPVTVNGIEMLKYRISAHNPEGKAIGHILRDGNKVQAIPLKSLAGYTQLDLGIVKYNFEIAAGKENFCWE